MLPEGYLRRCAVYQYGRTHGSAPYNKKQMSFMSSTSTSLRLYLPKTVNKFSITNPGLSTFPGLVKREFLIHISLKVHLKERARS